MAPATTAVLCLENILNSLLAQLFISTQAMTWIVFFRKNFFSPQSGLAIPAICVSLLFFLLAIIVYIVVYCNCHFSYSLSVLRTKPNIFCGQGPTSQ